MNLIEAREKLELAWCIETSYCPEDYDQYDPAWGQCAVTTCLLHEWFGGKMMKGWAINQYFKTRHYWNRIHGLDIDLTWRQFQTGTRLISIEEATFKDLVANPWMENKFNFLKELTTRI